MTPQTAGSVSLQPAEAQESASEQHSHPHPRRSYLSRAIGLLGRATEYCGELGPFTGTRWYLAKVLARLGVPGFHHIHIKAPDVKYPVGVRMYPSSDDFVFDQIFVQHEYAAVCKAIRDANFIMDLGANVGYASALFASCYPSAQLLCVEPDPGNYEQCVRNVAPYGNRVQVLLGAVWARRSKLTLVKGKGCDGREWATQVMESGDASAEQVEAWDIAALLDLAQQPQVDLLKIDIEGSEADVFAADTAGWLPRVRNICIELHGERCRETFFNALRGYKYDVLNHGEFTVCLNLRRAA